MTLTILRLHIMMINPPFMAVLQGARLGVLHQDHKVALWEEFRVQMNDKSFRVEGHVVCPSYNISTAGKGFERFGFASYDLEVVGAGELYHVAAEFLENACQLH
jgi:hypothetical protein